MRFTQKFKYNLGRPATIMGLMMATVFGGCSKENDDINELKDTVYTFSPVDGHKQLKNLEQISASADSAQVGRIIFRVLDGDQYAWEGVNLRGTYGVLKPAFDAAKGKGVSDGEFNRVSESNVNREFSKKITDEFGYKINFLPASTNQKQR